MVTEEREAGRTGLSRDEILRDWADLTGHPIVPPGGRPSLRGRPGAGWLTTVMAALVAALTGRRR
jgi:hypothetical protein